MNCRSQAASTVMLKLMKHRGDFWAVDGASPTFETVVCESRHRLFSMIEPSFDWSFGRRLAINGREPNSKENILAGQH